MTLVNFQELLLRTCHFKFCTISELVQDGFINSFKPTVRFPLTRALDESRHYRNKFSGAPRFEPRAAGWQVKSRHKGKMLLFYQAKISIDTVSIHFVTQDLHVLLLCTFCCITEMHRSLFHCTMPKCTFSVSIVKETKIMAWGVNSVTRIWPSAVSMKPVFASEGVGGASRNSQERYSDFISCSSFQVSLRVTLPSRSGGGTPSSEHGRAIFNLACLSKTLKCDKVRKLMHWEN